MSEGKKYLRRPDIRKVFELEPAFLELLRPFLDKAGLPYEVLDAPPKPEGESETTRRRRSS